MQTRTGWVTLIAIAGCSSGTAAPVPDANGQTGSPGYSCEQDCPTTAKSVVEWVNTVTPVPAFTRSVCTEEGFCRCETDGEPVDINPAWPCFGPRLRGGFCIAPGSEAPSCGVGDSSLCEAACQRVEQALLDDAKRKPDADLRDVHCSNSGRTCNFVVELDGACYANDQGGFLEEPAVPCP